MSSIDSDGRNLTGSSVVGRNFGSNVDWYSTCLFLERNRNAVDSEDIANIRTYD